MLHARQDRLLRSEAVEDPAGALAGYTALKALLVHLRRREMPARAVLKAAPLVLLGQLFFTKGALEGAFRWRDLAGRIETP